MCSHRVYKRRIPDVLMLFLASLLPLTWFKDDLYITYYDFDFPFPPLYGQERCFYIWDRLTALGTPYAKLQAEAPIQWMIHFLYNLQCSLVSLEKIAFVLLFFSAAFSMYLLAYSLTPDCTYRRGASIVAALFYIFNPIVAHVYMHDFLLSPFFVYAFLPLISMLFIRGLKVGKLIYAIFTGLSFLLTSLSFSNPAWGSIIFILLFSYLFFHVAQHLFLKDTGSIRFAIKYCIIFVLVFSLANAFWLVPQLRFLQYGYLQSTLIRELLGQTSTDVLKTVSTQSSMLNIFRLEGLPNFYFEGNPYMAFSYSSIYRSVPFIMIGTVIPLIGFSVLLIKKRGLDILFFAIIALASMFLMKGVHPPFGNIIAWLCDHVPFFGIYRYSYIKFANLLVLSYALLFGISIAELFARMQVKEKRRHGVYAIFLVLLLVCVVVVFPFPLWTGQVIPKQTNAYPGGHVQIPHYYRDADAWINEQTDHFRMYTLPFNLLFYAAYKWDHGYFGTDPTLWLLNKPTISRITDTSYLIPIMVAKALNEKDMNYLGKVLGLLNVKYLLLHRDTHWKSLSTISRAWWVLPSNSMDISEKYFEEVLRAQNGLHLSARFGKLDFYKNDYLVEHIYAH